MLKFTVTENEEPLKGRILRRIEAEGHVDAKGEENIICAAASMTIQTLAIFLAKRYPYDMDASFEPGISFVECEAEGKNKEVETAFEMTVEGLRSLAKRYPDDVAES